MSMSLTMSACYDLGSSAAAATATASRQPTLMQKLSSSVKAHRILSLLRVTVQEGPRNRAPRRRLKHSSGKGSRPGVRVRNASMKGRDAKLVPGMSRPCITQATAGCYLSSL